MTSDSDSNSAYEQGSPNTEDPALADIFSLDLLISRVEEMQHLVVAYERQWCDTVELLEKTQEAVLLLQRALERCFGESMVAERHRLAFWSVEQGDGKACSYRPAGWI